MTFPATKLKSEFYERLSNARGCEPCSVSLCQWIITNRVELDMLVGDETFADWYFDVENVCMQYLGGHITEHELSVEMNDVGDDAP